MQDEIGFILKRLEDLVIANRDLTLRLENTEKVNGSCDSQKDLITDAYNLTFLERAEKIFDEPDSRPGAVIVADINGLNKFNSLYGFSGGNKAIVKAYEIISESCSGVHYIIRINGGLFCVLLSQTDQQTVKDICSKICFGCSGAKKSIPGIAISISISAGCCFSTDPKETFFEVFNTAETRMNRRKLLDKDSVRSSIVSSVISTLNERYDDTHENIERMIKLSASMGTALHCENHILDELELSCVLHDLGKIAIRETIINKNAKLTKEEKKEIQLHPLIGSRIIRSVPEFAHVADHVLSHHEKWDGTGYPRKIKGEEIPLISRIIALVDAYDSMTSGRPYRDPLPLDHVVSEIISCGGTQFDPGLVQIFTDIITADQKM